MKDTLETSEVLFYAHANGDILRMDGGQVSPESFWASLPESTRLALAKAAPKCAGPWTDEEEPVRRAVDGDYLVAVVRYRSSGGCNVWVHDVGTRSLKDRESAQAAADEALRAKGWCLDG